MSPPTRDPLLTIDDVAYMFQMPRKTVENLARAGTLPGFKIGRAWRFRLAALERWQREREAAQSVPDDWS